jgi:hypothetical protein
MFSKQSVFSLALAFVTTLGISHADAKTRTLIGKISGSFTNTQSDTNNDGNKAVLLDVSGTSNLGPFTTQAIGEAVPTGSPAMCPNGNPGLEATLAPGTGWFVLRLKSDLIFGKTTTQTFCIDPLTTMVFSTGEATIVGGTGDFANATGSTKFTTAASTLFFDAVRNFFGGVTGEFSGVITTP